MTYTNFEKKNVQKLRTELDKVLKEFGEKNGLTFDLGTMRFTQSNLKVTMQAHTKMNATDQLERKKELAKIAGLRSIHKDGYNFVDYKMSRPKFSIVAEKDGKQYKMTLAYARAIFGGI